MSLYTDLLWSVKKEIEQLAVMNMRSLSLLFHVDTFQ